LRYLGFCARSAVRSFTVAAPECKGDAVNRLMGALESIPYAPTLGDVATIIRPCAALLVLGGATEVVGDTALMRALAADGT